MWRDMLRLLQCMGLTNVAPPSSQSMIILLDKEHFAHHVCKVIILSQKIINAVIGLLSQGTLRG